MAVQLKIAENWRMAPQGNSNTSFLYSSITDFNANTKIATGNPQLCLGKAELLLTKYVCSMVPRFSPENLLPILPDDLLRCKFFLLHPLSHTKCHPDFNS